MYKIKKYLKIIMIVLIYINNAQAVYTYRLFIEKIKYLLGCKKIWILLKIHLLLHKGR